MQEFSIAYGKSSRPSVTTNPELKSRMRDLVSRAYFNLYGKPLSCAEEAWVNSIVATGMQISVDERVAELSSREMVQLLENVIRISDEHLREAKRHIAMASNVFYLKETSLDTVCETEASITCQAVASTILSSGVAHSGRLDVAFPGEPIAS